MRDALLEKSEDERQALMEKIPGKPRRERQKRLLKYGLDAQDIADAVKVYHKTIVDMEKALADSDTGLQVNRTAWRTLLSLLTFRHFTATNGLRCTRRISPG